ncbi:hypothetical protein SCHPADRAFT_947010 [Schizopora paradoxa]|uniref:Chromatin elongation factor SPT5 n=1 Tax=Schizopora paradoxa TaxID=27342 RepID=A0A0H2R0L4_9AGAM|nr:hypothetical protein SCHPADRAFT_947010 [Schizopora paradoxa]
MASRFVDVEAEVHGDGDELSSDDELFGDIRDLLDDTENARMGPSSNANINIIDDLSQHPDTFRTIAEETAAIFREREIASREEQLSALNDADLPLTAWLPNHDDLILFEVRVKRGHEAELVLRLYRRTYLNDVWRPEMGSVFAIPSHPGRIFIEAKSPKRLLPFIESVLDVYTSLWDVVSLEDRVSLIGSFRPTDHLKVGSWVVVKYGLYAGDFGQIVDIDQNHDRTVVKLPSRILDSPSRKRRFKTGRPNPCLFTRAEAEKRFGSEAVSGIDPFTCDGIDYTRDGFCLAHIDYNSVKAARPSLSDVKLFLTAAEASLCFELFNKEAPHSPLNDIEIFNRASLDLASVSFPSNIRQGDRVKIASGPLAGMYARVVEPPVLQTVNVQIDDASLGPPNNQDPIVAVEVTALTKIFREGDFVEVNSGLYSGHRGVVVSTDDITITIQDDAQSDSITVPWCYIDYDTSQDTSTLPIGTGNPPTVQPRPPETKCMDHLAIEAIGKQAYVWKGKWKGKIGIVKSMSGLSAAVAFVSSYILGGNLTYVKRDDLVNISMQTLLTGKPPILTPAEYISFSKFLSGALSDRSATPPPLTNEMDDFLTPPPSDEPFFVHGKSSESLDVAIRAKNCPTSPTRKFVMHINNHRSAKIAGVKTGRVAVDNSPLKFPLSTSQAAEVLVEFTDARSNELREMIPVKDLSPKHTKAGEEHVIIRGDKMGSLVLHIRNKRDRARVYFEGTDKRKEGFFLEYKTSGTGVAITVTIMPKASPPPAHWINKLRKVPKGTLREWARASNERFDINAAIFVYKSRVRAEAGVKQNAKGWRGPCGQYHKYNEGVNGLNSGHLLDVCIKKLCAERIHKIEIPDDIRVKLANDIAAIQYFAANYKREDKELKKRNRSTANTPVNRSNNDQSNTSTLPVTSAPEPHRSPLTSPTQGARSSYERSLPPSSDSDIYYTANTHFASSSDEPTSSDRFSNLAVDPQTSPIRPTRGLAQIRRRWPRPSVPFLGFEDDEIVLPKAKGAQNNGEHYMPQYLDGDSEEVFPEISDLIADKKKTDMFIDLTTPKRTSKRAAATEPPVRQKKFRPAIIIKDDKLDSHVPDLFIDPVLKTEDRAGPSAPPVRQKKFRPAAIIEDGNSKSRMPALFNTGSNAGDEAGPSAPPVPAGPLKPRIMNKAFYREVIEILDSP